MQDNGINWNLLLFQVANLALLLAYLGLVVLALRRLPGTNKPLAVYGLWMLVILCLPFAGALLFLLEHPRPLQAGFDQRS